MKVYSVMSVPFSERSRVGIPGGQPWDSSREMVATPRAALVVDVVLVFPVGPTHGRQLRAPMVQSIAAIKIADTLSWIMRANRMA
jgi:hypothetical protein